MTLTLCCLACRAPADPLGLGVDPERLKVRGPRRLGSSGSAASVCRGVLPAPSWRRPRAFRAYPQQPCPLHALTCPLLPPGCPAGAHCCLQWYAEAEKTNGRWAMAAVAGILFTELLGKGKWFEVRGWGGGGAVPLSVNVGVLDWRLAGGSPGRVGVRPGCRVWGSCWHSGCCQATFS